MIPTPTAAGGGGGVGHNDLLLDRHSHHHSSYSFHDPGSGGRDNVSDDALDDRDDRVSERDTERDRDLDLDLKRPLPLEHMERDIEMRAHDSMEMRAVKKMRIEEGRTPASVGGIP